MITEIYNTFLKGLDVDTNPINYSNDNYYNAHNLRLIMDEELTSLTLTNGKGLKLIFTTYGAGVITPVKIKGACEIDNSLVVFTGSGSIHVIPFTDVDNGSVINLLSNTYRIVNKAFNFGDRIITIPRYERAGLRKIYWSDGVNPVRVVNIDEEEAVLLLKTVEEYALVQKCLLSTPSFSAITGGSLKSGVYRYAYCLFNDYGSQTSYSTLSQMIPIVSDDFVDATTNKRGWTFRGEESGITTSKGIQIRIVRNTTLSPMQSTFSNMRIVSLYYSSQTSIPEVSIVYEGVNSANVYIEDTGSLILGTISYEEFVASNMYIIPSTIETKNNYLFFGNVTETSYDVEYDARAYRFSEINITQYAQLYDSTLTSINWDVVQDGFDVPKTYDCANKYNGLEYDTYTGSTTTPRVWTENTKYQEDGVTLGGTGINVSYEFIYKAFSIGNPQYTNNLYLNPEDYNYIGYQRDEIYRFGIKLFFSNGESSFIKWIGDIRFPNYEDYTMLTTFDIMVLGIKFTVTNLPTEVTGYQIVRAIRNTGDQTVIDAGYIGHLRTGNSDTGYYFGKTGTNWTTLDSSNKARPKLYSSSTINPPHPSIVEYISPETTYNNISSVNYDRIDSYVGNIISQWLRTSGDTPSVDDNVSLSYLKPNPEEFVLTPVTKMKTTDCFKYQGVHDDVHSIIMGGKFGSVKLNSLDESPTNLNGVKGTTLLLKLYSDLTRTPDDEYLNFPAYTLRRKQIKPYGGYSYGAIQATEYIPCSPVRDRTISVIDVWGGDTFITWYDYLRIGWYDEIGSGEDWSQRKYAHIVRALVESKINLTYTSSPTILYYNLFTQTTANLAQSEYDYLAMWETSGSYLLANRDNPADNKYFEQDFNMYTYNPVFSSLHYEASYMAKPTSFLDSAAFPTRIYRSDKKIDGAIIDNWSMIKPFNFLDVDSKYGSVSKLYAHNNTLLCFQYSGISVLPIEERETVNTTAGHAVGIGTGDVLNRCDYLTSTSGTSFPDSVIGTNYGVYYVDSGNKKIAVLGQNIQYLSDMYKIMSYTAGKTFSTASTLYNPRYSELWFNIDGETIIFNEYLNCFTSTLDTTFEFGCLVNGVMHCISSTSNDSNSNMFALDKGNHGAYNSGLYYYDNGFYQPYACASALKYVVNPNNKIKNRFDSIDMNTYIYKDNVNFSHSYTFNGLVAKTLYQTCTQSSLHTTSKRKFGTWRYNTLRGDSSDRLHDNYLKLELSFNPDTLGITEEEDVKFVVNGISTNFIPTFIR